MSNRIVKGGYGRLEEGLASENINLGALVEYGGANDFRNHSVAGGDAMRMLATEAANPARQVRAAWNAADGIITANDQMTVQHMPKGTKVHTWLAAGQNVARGASLESAGNGALRAKTPQTDTDIGTPVYVAANQEADIIHNAAPTGNAIFASRSNDGDTFLQCRNANTLAAAQISFGVHNLELQHTTLDFDETANVLTITHAAIPAGNVVGLSFTDDGDAFLAANNAVSTANAYLDFGAGINIELIHAAGGGDTQVYYNETEDYLTIVSPTGEDIFIETSNPQHFLRVVHDAGAAGHEAINFNDAGAFDLQVNFTGAADQEMPVVFSNAPMPAGLQIYYAEDEDRVYAANPSGVDEFIETSDPDHYLRLYYHVNPVAKADAVVITYDDLTGLLECTFTGAVDQELDLVRRSIQIADIDIKLDPIVAYAHEAINNAGGGAPVRINVIVA